MNKTVWLVSSALAEPTKTTTKTSLDRLVSAGYPTVVVADPSTATDFKTGPKLRLLSEPASDRPYGGQNAGRLANELLTGMRSANLPKPIGWKPLPDVSRPIPDDRKPDLTKTPDRQPLAVVVPPVVKPIDALFERLTMATKTEEATEVVAETVVPPIPTATGPLTIEVSGSDLVAGWSRIAYLSKAAESLPSSSVVVWIDPSISLWRPNDFQPGTTWPHASWTSAVGRSNRIVLQSRWPKDEAERMLANLNEEAALSGRSAVKPFDESMIVGSTAAVAELRSRFDKILTEEVLGRFRVTDVGSLLAVLAKRHPDLFCIVSRIDDWRSTGRRLIRSDDRNRLPLWRWMAGRIDAVDVPGHRFDIQPPFPRLYKLVLATVVDPENDGRRLDEWIGHHRRRGVDRFYVILDGSSSISTTDDGKPTTTTTTADPKQPKQPTTAATTARQETASAVASRWKNRGIVDVIIPPPSIPYGRNRRRLLAESLLSTARIDANWIAILNTDEFVWTTNGVKIPAAIDRLSRPTSTDPSIAAAVELPRLVFCNPEGRKTPASAVRSSTRRLPIGSSFVWPKSTDNDDFGTNDSYGFGPSYSAGGGPSFVRCAALKSFGDRLHTVAGRTVVLPAEPKRRSKNRLLLCNTYILPSLEDWRAGRGISCHLPPVSRTDSAFVAAAAGADVLDTRLSAQIISSSS
jgi:hypothetical protein